MPRITLRPLGVADLARVAVFAALIAALAVPVSFHLPVSSVPFTLQTMGVMLTGLLLGPVGGSLAVLAYLTLGAVGLPVFAGGTGGLGVFAGHTGGFLIGFLVAAFVIGLIAHGGTTLPFWRAGLACLVGGIGVVYAIGVPWMAWRTGLSLGEAMTAMGPFLAWDVAKAGLATSVAVGVYKAYPAVLDRRVLLIQKAAPAS
jgi:biotin transport system substrate-specific component